MYFRLKSIDLVCMKKLDTKVNIIPIIAKADTISKTELQKFKVSIHKLLSLRKIEIQCIQVLLTIIGKLRFLVSLINYDDSNEPIIIHYRVK